MAGTSSVWVKSAGGPRCGNTESAYTEIHSSLAAPSVGRQTLDRGDIRDVLGSHRFVGQWPGALCRRGLRRVQREELPVGTRRDDVIGDREDRTVPDG